MDSENDWGGRARREAAAIYHEAGPLVSESYDTIIGLMAMAWLQGVNLGAHDTLRQVEDVFGAMQAER